MRIVKSIIIIAAVFAAVCANAQQPEKPRITVAVGGKSLLYYLPLTIAERKGYFKAEGLDVEIVDFPGGAKALQAMVGGSADVVSGAYEHTINMQAKGQPIVALALQGRYNGIVLGISKAKAAQYKSAADLKGMKVGVTAPGSSTHMSAQNLAVKAGLKPDSFSAIGVGASSGAVAAMKHGNIDAISNLDPVITKLETDGDIVVVSDTRTAKGMKEVYGGAYHAGCIYAPTDWVKKNPNTVQAIVNAFYKTQKWLEKATPEDIAKNVPEEYYLGDKALYLAAVTASKPMYSVTGIIPPEGQKNALDMLTQFDPEMKDAKVDLSKTFTDKFVKKAAASM